MMQLTIRKFGSDKASDKEIDVELVTVPRTGELVTLPGSPPRKFRVKNVEWVAGSQRVVIHCYEIKAK